MEFEKNKNTGNYEVRIPFKYGYKTFIVSGEAYKKFGKKWAKNELNKFIIRIVKDLR